MKNSNDEDSHSHDGGERKKALLEKEWTSPSPSEAYFANIDKITQEFELELIKRLEQAVLKWQHEFVTEEIREFVDNLFCEICHACELDSESILHHPPTEASYADNKAVCGHIFEEGDVIYRCRNCAMDETCVQCSVCFLSTNHHRQHDYRYSISHANGGCCDCGDTEAWKSSPNCAIHHPETSNIDVFRDWPSRFIHLLRIGLRVLMDFFTKQLESVGEGPKLQGSLDYADFLEGEEFVVVLWNDDEHTFDEVTQSLMKVLHKTSEACRKMACEVDLLGRYVIMHSSSRRRCRLIGTELQSAGLLVSIYRAIEYNKQEVATLILNVLIQLSQDNRALRKLIIVEGTSPYTMLSSSSTERTQQSTSESRGSIIGRLMRCEHRLWKYARSQFRSLLMKGIFLDSETRFLLANVFSANYEAITEALMNEDREVGLSIHSLAVQLFTTPSIAYYLLVEGNFLEVLFRVFEKVISTACQHDPSRFSRFTLTNQALSILSDMGYLLSCDALHRLLQNHIGRIMELLLPTLERLQGLDSERRQTDIHVEYESQEWALAFTIIERVVECCLEKILLAVQNAPQSSLYMIEVLSWAIRRSYQLSKSSEDMLLVIEDSSHQTKLYPSLRILHDVPVSVHHPYHWTLSFLVNHLVKTGVPIEQIYVSMTSHANVKTTPITPRSDANEQSRSFEHPSLSMLTVINDALQPFWLRAELKAKMWIRNGMAVHHRFASYFFGTFLSTTFPCLDLHLLQFVSSVIEPALFVHHLLYAFHLTDWTQTEVEAVHKIKFLAETDDESRMLTMAIQWNLFMIYWFSERSLISDMTPEEDMKRYLIHVLASGPTPLSRIRQQMTQSYSFEDADSHDYASYLIDVADFQPAKSLAEEGCYVIRDSAFQEHDPYYFRLSQQSREKALNYRKVRETRLGLPPRPNAMLIPRLHRLNPGYEAMYRVIVSHSWGDALYSHLARLVNSTSEISLREDLLDSTLRLLLLPFYDDTLEMIQSRDTFIESIFDMIMASRYLEDFQQGSLLDLLLGFRKDTDFQALYPAIDELFRRLRSSLGVNSPRQTFLENLLNHHLPTTALPTSATLNEISSCRSTIARQKQKQAMLELQERQRQFLTRHIEEHDGPVSIAGRETESHFLKRSIEDTSILASEEDWGTCLSCREPLSIDETRPFGILGLYQLSKMRRHVLHDDSFNRALIVYGDHLREWDRMIRHPYEDATSSDQLEKQRQKVDQAIAQTKKLQAEQERYLNGVYPGGDEDHNGRDRAHGFVSTCGHLAHFACLKTYLEDTMSRRSLIINKLLEALIFPCPLCHAPCNAMIPIMSRSALERHDPPHDLMPESFSGERNNDWTFLESYRTWLARTTLSSETSATTTTEVSLHPGQPSLSVTPRLRRARGRQPLSPSILTIRHLLQLFGDESLTLLGIVNGDNDLTVGGREGNMEEEEAREEDETEDHSHEEEDQLTLEDPESSFFDPQPMVSGTEIHVDEMSWRFLRSALGMSFSRDPLVFAEILAYSIACCEIATRDPFGVSIEREFYFQALSEKEKRFLKTFMLFSIHIHEENDTSDFPLLKQYLDLFLGFGDSVSTSNESAFFEPKEDIENPNSRRRPQLPLSIRAIDTFDLIVILCILSPVLRSQPQILLRWGLLIETMKTLLSLCELSTEIPFSSIKNPEHFIFEFIIMGTTGSPNDHNHENFTVALNLLRIYLLPFLRRLGCLMYCVFDRPVPENIANDEGHDEFEQLLNYLDIYSFPMFFRDVPTTHSETLLAVPSLLRKYIETFCEDWKRSMSSPRQLPQSKLEYPLRLQFIALPEAYQTCLESMKDLCCYECGQHPRRPAMCLFCETVTCTGGHRSQVREFNDNYSHANR